MPANLFTPLLAIGLALLLAVGLPGAALARPLASTTVGARPIAGAATSPDPLALRLCEALHAIPAARRAACCQVSGPAPRGLVDECTRLLTAALHAGAVSLDAAGIERCAAARGAALDACDWVGMIPPAPPPACQGLIEGKLASGATCGSPVECAAGLTCVDLGMGRRCSPPPGVGYSCNRGSDALSAVVASAPQGPHPECAGYCRLSQCAALTPLGSACKASRECGADARCADHVCVAGATAPLGGACTGSDCGGGAVCLAGRCTALKSAGEACSSPYECKAACLRPPGAQTGTCGIKCAVTPADWTLPGG